MAEIKIVASSPKAGEVSEKMIDKAQPKLRYPFDELAVGQSFTIAKDEANMRSLQVRASQKSKAGKRFVVVVHNELQLVEVARTA
jgi:hypothetical protein